MPKQTQIYHAIIALEEGKRYAWADNGGGEGMFEFVGVNLGMYLTGWWLVRVLDDEVEPVILAVNPANVVAVRPAD